MENTFYYGVAVVVNSKPVGLAPGFNPNFVAYNASAVKIRFRR
jgi:hypothetical protein